MTAVPSRQLVLWGEEGHDRTTLYTTTTPGQHTRRAISGKVGGRSHLLTSHLYPVHSYCLGYALRKQLWSGTTV